jgi:GNAT superfamily N-acetyltransferase
MSTQRFQKQDRDLEEIKRNFGLLSPWNQRKFMLFIRWLYLKQQINEIPLNWVKLITDLDRDMQVFGMPHKVWRWLEKWFNHRPWPDSERLIVGKTKFWVDHTEKDEDLEIYITHHGHWIANIWAEMKGEDWTLYGLNVRSEKFRRRGLGTLLLKMVVERARTLGVRSILEIIEKDCEWPKRKEEFSNLLDWYKHQGFVLTEDEKIFILTLAVNP